MTDNDKARLQALSDRLHSQEQTIEIGCDYPTKAQLKRAEELRADRYAIDAALDALGGNAGPKMQKALGDTILGTSA